MFSVVLGRRLSVLGLGGAVATSCALAVLVPGSASATPTGCVSSAGADQTHIDGSSACVAKADFTSNSASLAVGALGHDAPPRASGGLAPGDTIAISEATSASLVLAISMDGGIALSEGSNQSAPTAIAIGPGSLASVSGNANGATIALAGPGAAAGVSPTAGAICNDGPSFAGDLVSGAACLNLGPIVWSVPGRTSPPVAAQLAP